MKLQIGEPPAGPRGRKAARKAAFLLANTLDQWSEGRLARLGNEAAGQGRPALHLTPPVPPRLPFQRNERSFPPV
jgi:hypothetical protein